MSGTKEGAAKSAATLKARDPLYFAKIGRKGGQSSRGGGFALMDAEAHRAASAKGGATSRRTKAKKSEQ